MTAISLLTYSEYFMPVRVEHFPSVIQKQLEILRSAYAECKSLIGRVLEGLPKKMLQLITSESASISDFLLQPTGSCTANQSYFVFNGEKKIMVFKPTEGESVVFPGIAPRSAYRRQIAAYLIDTISGGKIGVPLSVLGHHAEKGSGSLQLYVENDGTLMALSAQERRQISVRDLHYQTLHRLRLYDLDGHLGNLLCKRKPDGTIKLIPIDFDCVLPHLTEESHIERVQLKLGWRLFPQLDKPWDPEVQDHLMNLNLPEEKAVLETLGFPDGSIRLFLATTYALQSAVRNNLTVGESVDYLDSEKFKALFLAASDENLKELLEQSIAELPSRKELQDFSDFVMNKDFRSAFKAVEKMIATQVPSDEAIAYLQQHARCNKNVFISGFYLLSDALEEAGRKAESEKLRQFLI